MIDFGAALLDLNKPYSNFRGLKSIYFLNVRGIYQSKIYQ